MSRQRLWGCMDHCGSVFPQSISTTKRGAVAWLRDVRSQARLWRSVDKTNPGIKAWRRVRVVRFSVVVER